MYEINLGNLSDNGNVAAEDDESDDILPGDISKDVKFS